MRKVGNRVACMEGDDAADLAGKIVALADQIKPTYELMEALRAKPGMFLDHTNIKPDWVAMFKRIPTTLQTSLLSSISLSALSKIPVVAQHQKADEVILAMSFLSGKVVNSSSVKSSDSSGSGKDVGRLDMHLVKDRKTREKTVSHLLVVVIEALFKLPKVEFVLIMRALRKHAFAPSLSDSVPFASVWSGQALIDIRAERSSRV